LQRELAVEFKQTIDWNGLVDLETEIFEQEFSYDAMFNEADFWLQKS
jgi:hypothetical protein